MNSSEPAHSIHSTSRVMLSFYAGLVIGRVCTARHHILRLCQKLTTVLGAGDGVVERASKSFDLICTVGHS